MSKKHSFDAIPSGDYESFCFDVDKETFINIKGEEPDKFDRSYFNKGKYRIYPSDLLGLDNDTRKVHINLEITEIE